MLGKLRGARRSFASPEGNAGRRALSVLDDDARRPAFNPANAPRRIAQQHDLAGHAFDGEVFVDRADHRTVGLGDNGEQGIVGNRAAARDGGKARAAARAQLAVDAVVMEIGAVASALRGNALGKHFDDLVKRGARKIAIGIGSLDEREEFVFVPAVVSGILVLAAGATRDRATRHNLLCQDIERRFGKNETVQISRANGAHQDSTLGQIVARGDEEASLGNRATPVATAAYTLQGDCNRARRADVADQIDGSDVDAQLKRGGRYQHLYLAFFQLAFRLQAQLAREATVVGRDIFFAQPLTEVVRHALGEAACVHEHERRTVGVHQFDKALINFIPHFVRSDGTKFRAGHLDSEVERALVAHVDDYRFGPGVMPVRVARQEPRYFVDRLLRRGEADAHGRAMGEFIEPFKGERKMHAALVVRYRMNLVDDQRFHVAKNGAALLGGQQNVERLGCRYQNVRRALEHQAAVLGQRVAGADRGTNLGHQEAALACHLQNFAERDFEVLLNVIAQSFERRYVENFGAIAQVACQRFAHQPVYAGQKGGQRLAGPGGSRDQRGIPGENVRPALLLRFGWSSEARDEPLLNEWMGPGKGRGDCGRHEGNCNGN